METDNEKNIWLVPTFKETVLFKDHTGFFAGKNYQIPKTINSSVIGFNIYITNDETIENRDYYIDVLTNLIYRAERTAVTRKCFKKIILTTDINLRDVQKIPTNTLYWFCEDSKKLGKPIEFIETRKEHREGDLFFYEAILPKKENTNWLQAFSDSKGNLHTLITMKSVHVLNEDGAQTDITDKPELWHIEDENNERLNQCPTFSIKDESGIEDKQQYRKPTFKETFALSFANEKQKTEEKKQYDHFCDMQYYMEYCQKNGYVTPQDWMTNHKHY